MYNTSIHVHKYKYTSQVDEGLLVYMYTCTYRYMYIKYTRTCTSISDV